MSSLVTTVYLIWFLFLSKFIKADYTQNSSNQSVSSTPEGNKSDVKLINTDLNMSNHENISNEALQVDFGRGPDSQ